MVTRGILSLVCHRPWTAIGAAPIAFFRYVPSGSAHNHIYPTLRCDDRVSMRETREPALVMAFRAELAVERLDVHILRRLLRLD